MAEVNIFEREARNELRITELGQQIIEQAQKGASEGGIPIGAVLVMAATAGLKRSICPTVTLTL